MRKKLIKVFIEKNNQINLSAIRNEDLVMIKHIQDSLELNKVLKLRKGSKICDIGTGGGFPLLPLAMSNLDCKFVGIDARRKKVDAVNEMIKDLGANNVKCVRSRIEDYKGNFDYITARAVGYIDKLFDWSYGILKKGGSFVLYKQKNVEEKSLLKSLCEKHKCKLELEHEYRLFPDDIDRIIYIIKRL